MQPVVIYTTTSCGFCRSAKAWFSARGISFSEVDVNGNDLLDFHFTDNNTTYRAIKVPLTAFDLGVLRSSTAGP